MRVTTRAGEISTVDMGLQIQGTYGSIEAKRILKFRKTAEVEFVNVCMQSAAANCPEVEEMESDISNWARGEPDYHQLLSMWNHWTENGSHH